MDMFESSIGRLVSMMSLLSNLRTDDEQAVSEPELFKRFKNSAAAAALWLEQHVPRKAGKMKIRGNELKFVDELLEITEETELLKELKDIRDELNMIKTIFNTQKNVLAAFERCIREQLEELDQDEDDRELLSLGLQRYDTASTTGSRNYGFREQEQLIVSHINDVQRMDAQAEAIFESLRQLLDFKQMHASSIEARFAREQAGLTARQGETIMVFTIVTIVFLPMSFVAAFLTINIKAERFEAGLTISYVASLVFGIGLTVSFVLILLAFLVDDVKTFFKDLFKRSPWRKQEEIVTVSDEKARIYARPAVHLAMERLQTLEERDSFEPHLLSRVTTGISARSRRTITASPQRFRRGSMRDAYRISEDLELG